MIIKVTPDMQKVSALRKMAQITLERVEETDIIKYASNVLNDYYDIIHKLSEAVSLINGVKIKGDGAHQELIDFVCKKLKINDGKRIFLQQMRDYRNRIAYEGFIVNKNYISLNKGKINEIIDKLSESVKKELKEKNK
jgi:hypothetical protein